MLYTVLIGMRLELFRTASLVKPYGTLKTVWIHEINGKPGGVGL
jgi:hypothetical protein